jgi:hypothetical protein
MATVWGERSMLGTITLGSCVSVQGLVVGQMADGKIMVKVDEKTFVGYPVGQKRVA